MSATSSTTSSPNGKVHHRPREIFVPDPVLGWRLSANQQIHVPFRKSVRHTTNRHGWRTVANSDASEGPAIGFYGCSFTYGTALDDSETFTSLLQSRFPNHKILNRGVGGYGMVQSYLAFRRDVISGQVGAGIFCLIGDHKYRNVPYPDKMRMYHTPAWHGIGVEHIPFARMNPAGGVSIRYVPISQPIAMDDAIYEYLPDEVMLNALAAALIGEIFAFASQKDIPVHFVLLDNLDADLNRHLCHAHRGVTDISTPHDRDHRFLPQDLHPNVEANALYADRLETIVRKLQDLPGAR